MYVKKNETVTATSIKFDESVSRLRDMYITVNSDTQVSEEDGQVLDNVKIMNVSKDGKVNSIQNASVRFTENVVHGIANFLETHDEISLCITCVTAKRGEKEATFAISTISKSETQF